MAGRQPHPVGWNETILSDRKLAVPVCRRSTALGPTEEALCDIQTGPPRFNVGVQAQMMEGAGKARDFHVLEQETRHRDDLRRAVQVLVPHQCAVVEVVPHPVGDAGRAAPSKPPEEPALAPPILMHNPLIRACFFTCTSSPGLYIELGIYMNLHSAVGSQTSSMAGCAPLSEGTAK